MFVNHEQDDWVQWLPLAEFAAHNGTSESTKCTTFFAIQDVDPRTPFAAEPTQERDQRWLDVDQVQATIQHVHEHFTVEMRCSQAVQEQIANRGRIPVPYIPVGYKVWLDARNLRTTCPTRKLDWKPLDLIKCTGESPHMQMS